MTEKISIFQFGYSDYPPSIKDMPRATIFFGRDLATFNAHFKLGIYWKKNNEAPLGCEIYDKRFEITFRTPVTISSKIFK